MSPKRLLCVIQFFCLLHDINKICFFIMTFKNIAVNKFYLFYSGTIGHVAHGKSTVVKAISGVQVTYFCIKNILMAKNNFFSFSTFLFVKKYILCNVLLTI